MCFVSESPCYWPCSCPSGPGAPALQCLGIVLRAAELLRCLECPSVLMLGACFAVDPSVGALPYALRAIPWRHRVSCGVCLVSCQAHAQCMAPVFRCALVLCCELAVFLSVRLIGFALWCPVTSAYLPPQFFAKQHLVCSAVPDCMHIGLGVSHAFECQRVRNKHVLDTTTWVASNTSHVSVVRACADVTAALQSRHAEVLKKMENHRQSRTCSKARTKLIDKISLKAQHSKPR